MLLSGFAPLQINYTSKDFTLPPTYHLCRPAPLSPHWCHLLPCHLRSPPTLHYLEQHPYIFIFLVFTTSSPHLLPVGHSGHITDDGGGLLQRPFLDLQSALGRCSVGPRAWELLHEYCENGSLHGGRGTRRKSKQRKRGRERAWRGAQFGTGGGACMSTNYASP